MTILAGILSRSSEHLISDDMSQALQALLSRHPQDHVVVEAHSRCILAKVDVHAFGEPAVRRDADGSLSMLCGEPLIAHPGSDEVGTRSDDLATIHAACEQAAWASLSRAQGCLLPCISPRRLFSSLSFLTSFVSAQCITG